MLSSSKEKICFVVAFLLGTEEEIHLQKCWIRLVVRVDDAFFSQDIVRFVKSTEKV